MHLELSKVPKLGLTVAVQGLDPVAGRPLGSLILKLVGTEGAWHRLVRGRCALFAAQKLNQQPSRRHLNTCASGGASRRTGVLWGGDKN